MGLVVCCRRVLKYGGNRIKGLKDRDDRDMNRAFWNRDLIVAFNELLQATRFPQEQQIPAAAAEEDGDENHGGVDDHQLHQPNLLFVMDESLMEYTSNWCTACNLLATRHIEIKGHLFRGGNNCDPDGKASFLSDVPLSAHLPIGTRMMHDAYLFIYLIATFISVMLSKVNADMNQTQLWRTDGLIRLYVGYLLFVLSERLNPVKRSMTFEQWYMFLFFDVQLWERATTTRPQQQEQEEEPGNNDGDGNHQGGTIWGDALASLFSSRVRAPVTRRPPQSRSNLLVAGLHELALHNFANASDSLHSKEMRVLEVVRRITRFAKVKRMVDAYVHACM
jgi:hypothetical protein